MDLGKIHLIRALLVLMTLSPTASFTCPRACSCPQPDELHCTFRSLVMIPSGVSKHVKRMNLGFNRINKVTDKSLAGLRKLELLLIHGNDIHSLPDGVFRDLQSVQMLKMSYNKLTEISRHTLQGLWSLARLHVDHNQLEFLHPDAFQGLVSLRLLQLEGNRLQQLHPATFATFTLMNHFHVSTVRHLYLSDNGLRSLPSSLVATMPQLENLYLHGNPWTCDCNIRWLHDWNKNYPGVLKCKKEKTLPGGQLCSKCSSPHHLQGEELQTVKNLLCSSPIINATQRTSPPDDVESEVLTTKDFSEPFGNISLGLTDAHGNEVDLECSIKIPGESVKVNWEQVNQPQLASNITLSVEMECPVNRETYERLWRLIAYYSNVPAHLKQGIMLSKEPYLSYEYRQDSEKDALYYTGIKVHMTAQPAWLMQTAADLRLNRLHSSANTVHLILRTNISEMVDVKLVERQRRTWVMIESTNTSHTVLSTILGDRSEMNCNVHSFGQPVIQWMLPDGTKVEAPYRSPDNRMSVSREGQLVIQAASHRDAGTYYCIAKVHGDLAVLPFHLTVQESSSPVPGEDFLSVQGFTGKPISLPCMTSGSPDAEIYWILPSSIIVGSQANSSRALVFPNGTLHIPQTQLSDNGHYKCIAINQHGVDTLVTTLSLARHSGVMRPLRRFPARPQSASGVNTQIQVPTEDTEDASGDVEMAVKDLSRRRIPGSMATGRRNTHPTRNIWRRPISFRKSTGSYAVDRNYRVENRRKINVSKTKIDPEKWADILVKIRDRNAQNGLTPLPVKHVTTRMVTEQTTQLQEAIEGSSDGVMDYFTTPHTPGQDTRGMRVTSNSYTAFNTHDMTKHITHTTQTPYNAQHTAPDVNLDPHITSNSAFSLPQTTSVSPDVVTFWEANTNMTSKKKKYADRVKAADLWKIYESSGKQDTNDREPSSNGSHIITSVSLRQSQTNWDESGKYLEESATTLQSHSQASTFDNPQSQAMLATVFPPTTVASTNTRRRAEGRSNFRKKNHQRRPNRRKKKLNKSTQFIATTPMKALLATIKTTGSSQLKIESSTATIANINTSVPFSGSHTMSSEDSSVYGYDVNATTKPPLSAFPSENSSILPLAKPPLKSTSTAPSFPQASPRVVELSSKQFLGISDIPGEQLEIFTLTSDHGFTSSTSSSLEEMQRENIAVDLESHPVPTDVRVNQSEHQYTSDEKMLFNEAGVLLSLLLPSSPPSSGLLSEQEPTAIARYTSKALITSIFEDDLDMAQITTEKPMVELLYHSSSHDKTTGSKVEVPEESTNIASEITHPYATLSRPDDIFPSTVAPYVAPSETLSTRATQAPSFSMAIQQNIQDEQIQFSITPEPQRTSEFYLTTKTADRKLVLTPISPTVKLSTTQSSDIRQVATSTPTTDQFSQGQLRSTQDISGKDQLPVYGSIPRGKPRITTNSFQTFTVKAETDVQLPCEAEGEPMPFLSWTNVASGTNITQNTKVQRFEVHSNGTLIIRNPQPMDEGQYLCTAQNQYGTDTVVSHLVILSQRPLVLQPRQRDVTVFLGDKVSLDCTAEGHPMPQVTWVLPNHIHMTAVPHGATPQQRVSVLSNGTLQISQTNYADRGIYKCIGSSAAGSDTVSVQIYVLALPPVIQQMNHENITVVEGANAYIHCSVSGAPQPIIHWITPDGGQLSTSDLSAGHNIFLFPNGTLFVQGLGLRNAGRYECLARNVVATSRREVILSVMRNVSFAKANIMSSPHRTDVVYGGRLLLDCVAEGEPKPRIIWRTPSKKLVDAQYSFDPRIAVLPNGTITIHSVTDKDSGDYLCVARNKLGDDYVLLRVNVLTRPAKIKQKQQQLSQEVIYGGDLKVDCVASGLPNPEISWALPDGTMVNPVKRRDNSIGGRSRRYVVFDNGTLYFNDVGMPEEGDYTCYAENQLGKDEMKVRIKVKVTNSPPKIQDKDQNMARVFYGETVALKCNTKGESMPLITWISPTNRVITPSLDKYKILDDGSLVVQKVQRFDGGNYTCMARNNAGQDYKVIRLEVLVTSPVINGLSGSVNTITVTMVQDQQKILDCVAKGTPSPRVIWVLPGNVILPAPYNSNRMTVHQNGSLEIRAPKKSDSGKLSCIARNEGGEVRLVVNLNVKEAFERPHNRGPKTESFSLTVGNTMTLNCSSEGATLPHVTWILPNGTRLQNGAQLSKFFHRPDGSLIITNPSVAEAGTYRCLGHDFQGLVEHVITLFHGRKPEIINRYNSPVNIMIGERLLLDCVTSVEPLRLTWTLPSGVVLNRPQTAGRYTVLVNGTLVINHVSVYDRGSYVCRVANEYGSSLLAVSLNVIAYPPRITSGPPSVTYAKHGVAIQLNCIATGIPRVDIAWETPDKTRLAVSAQPRLFGNKYLHPQGSLIIQNPSQRDAGVYRCTARNAIGIDSKRTFLNVF